MAQIRILPDRVANQIAAGEVVERPAAVVKELIENSIDAGAQKIEIEFRNGGKSYLRVEDDGYGMNPDQALLCLERHATSKIRKASDLDEIQTFGFRGEALPSISSVSRFTLRTRSKDSSEGNEILINGGKMIHVKECGMPQGTRIEVAHLFNSVPGRRKFLKTEVTESSHIIHLAKLYALAHPQITFSLIEGARTLFRSPACEDLLDRVREIFGKSLSECLAPIEVKTEGMNLGGLLGKPGYSRPTRKEMLFYVNRRPVESKTMSYALLEAYHTYAPKGRFPPAILFLTIDSSLVDVNIHPAKRELRFREEMKVRSFLIESILKSIREISGEISTEIKEIELEKDSISGQMVPKIDDRLLERFKPSQLPQNTQVFDQNPVLEFSSNTREINSPVPKNSSGDFSKEYSTKLPIKPVVGLRGDVNVTWRLVDHSHGEMAIFITPQGLVVFHCRSAYERIRFEELEDSFKKNKKVESQSLLLSESIELDGVESGFLQKSLPQLSEIGFVIEEFGRNFFRLEACPTWLDPEKAISYLRDFLEIASDAGGESKIEIYAKEAMIKQATKNLGVKGSFSENEIIRLANQLLSCRNPYTCPQGRPIYYELPIRDFESRFRRKI
ncbi:MAG: DNA mismatch repair endonuclease MutL [Verrucomicrobiia bacterium]